MSKYQRQIRYVVKNGASLFGALMNLVPKNTSDANKSCFQSSS